jgi:hypothetical protein
MASDPKRQQSSVLRQILHVLEWIYLAQNKHEWRDDVNTRMNNED